MKPQRVYVTGLPRSGSTLLCQLLAQHPDVSCDGMTSPLFGVLEGLRTHLTGDDSFLSRLDTGFEENYARIESVYKGILSGWLDEHHDRPFVVDKSRGWLRGISFLNELDPGFRMIVCIRELGQLFGSIEAAHEKTMLLGYRDGMSHHSSDGRATQVFDQTGVVGAPLKAIRDFQEEITDPRITSRVYYVSYEALISEPVETMRQVHDFIGAEMLDIDPGSLQVFPRESDSHYGMKWPHATFDRVNPLVWRAIHGEIQTTLENRFAWYYHAFYPDPTIEWLKKDL